MSTHRIRRTAIAVALATAAAAIVLALGVFAASRVVAVYAVVVGALLLSPLTRLARTGGEAQGSQFESALHRKPDAPLRPPELIRIERELMLGLQSAGGFHNRLLPLLREAAAGRLAVKRHVDLVRQPDAAKAVLGDEAWELVRPDRPAPLERTGPGVSPAVLGSLLDTLESI